MHRSLAATRTEAQRLIEQGLVEVGGVPAPKPATLVSPDADISLTGPGSRYVSRGGIKLEAALTTFGLEVDGRRCLDVGASTGGFTDCLLQHGARHVTALDVGYGQLAWKLRNDERVQVCERTNVRHVDPASIGAPFDLVVVDVSFISIDKIAVALASLGHAETDYVLLVKPQFEAGKDEVGKGGIIRDPSTHQQAIRRAIAGLADAGLGAVRLIASPIAGAKGNVEFLVLARFGARMVTESEVAEVVAE